MNDWLNDDTRYAVVTDMGNGLVPKTYSGTYEQPHFLMDNTNQRTATWSVPPNATTSYSGYMSANDKAKLDGMSSIVISDDAPTDTNILVWIDSDESAVHVLAGVDDTTFSSSDTFSSNKINNTYVAYGHSQTLTESQMNQFYTNVGFPTNTAGKLGYTVV